MLHGLGAGRLADFVEKSLAILAFRLDPYLDQFMYAEREFDFREHGASETLVADKDDRLKRMCAGAQRASRGGSQSFKCEFVHADTVSQSMARSKSSKVWLKRHVNDSYVKKAKALGYRSRAVFKLEQIDAKDRLFRAGARVVDLGAAPGGWSQLAVSKVGPKGAVVAVDLLEIAPISGVTVLRGDFREARVRDAVKAALGDSPADVVLSDMLPNVSGIPGVDQANAAVLTELAIEYCCSGVSPGLKPEGVFVVKVFQGEAFQGLLGRMKEVFRTVTTRKPEASRDASREIYLLGRGLRSAQVAQDSD